jgi:ribosomal protein S18 acetylase RimI-like enzyme
MHYTIRNLTPLDLPRVEALQQEYAKVYPGAPVVPSGLYLSPAFHEGQDVFCALTGEGGEERLVAYAPVYVQIVEDGPAHLPNRVWTEVKARPDLEDAEPVKEQLLELVMKHAQDLLQHHPGREARVLFDYRANEVPAINFIVARGFTFKECVFYMYRDLNAPFPAALPPQGIEIFRWKMESEPEQQAYVAARNECFPEAPVKLDEWQYYMRSPQWSVGAMIAAVSGQELVGAVNVYWNEEENQQIGRKVGFTEDIFVRQPWRGKGIARAAIVEALRYLKEHGLDEAHLSVRARNENALSLYKDLGYQVAQESRFYEKPLT